MLKKGVNLMQKLTVSEIVKATAGILISGVGDAEITGVKIDSRIAEKGDLFVPLIGENGDGHDYIEKAIANGASAVIAHKDIQLCADTAVVKVNDTLKALGDIARFYKEKYDLPTVSVTGSVGKTTTKDLIQSAMQKVKNTVKTRDNYNNNIGVPLTVFTIEEEHEAAVIELGMNHFGEIDYLVSIANPDIAVITNIGMSHIENLGSRDGIFKAKMEITNRFDGHNVLILNGDDKYLNTVSKNKSYKVIKYGIVNPECDVCAKDIQSNGLYGTKFIAVADGKEYTVNVPIPGEHNVYNALAAICVCKELGIDIKCAIEGIANPDLTANRLEIEEVNNKTLIKDYYNASPDSIRAALKILSYAKDGRKVAILGDVLEMGDYARDEHYKLGTAVAENNIDLLITAGDNAKYIADGAKDKGFLNAVSFKTTDEAAEYVKDNLSDNDAVLIKASHGMNFGKIYDAINI